MIVRLTRSVWQSLITAARRAAPEECCGLLLGHDGLIEEARQTANMAADRRHRFEIDPQALIDAYRAARAGGPELIGFFHSHPAGPPAPSPTDQAMASGDGSVWAIVTEPAVTFWRDEEARFVPLSYTLEDR